MRDEEETPFGDDDLMAKDPPGKAGAKVNESDIRSPKPDDLSITLGSVKASETSKNTENYYNCICRGRPE
jgi:hypothetical protein